MSSESGNDPSYSWCERACAICTNYNNVLLIYFWLGDYSLLFQDITSMFGLVLCKKTKKQLINLLNIAPTLTQQTPNHLILQPLRVMCNWTISANFVTATFIGKRQFSSNYKLINLTESISKDLTESFLCFFKVFVYTYDLFTMLWLFP